MLPEPEFFQNDPTAVQLDEATHETLTRLLLMPPGLGIGLGLVTTDQAEGDASAIPDGSNKAPTAPEIITAHTTLAARGARTMCPSTSLRFRWVLVTSAPARQIIWSDRSPTLLTLRGPLILRAVVIDPGRGATSSRQSQGTKNSLCRLAMIRVVMGDLQGAIHRR